MKSYRFWITALIAFGIAALPQADARTRRKSRKAAPLAAAAAVPAIIPDELTGIALIAKGAILIDGFNGKTLFEKEAYTPLYPASATKILTALLVIEAGNLDQEVVIELSDTQVEPSAVYFKPGEVYTRRELLYALMLKSANDVAQALARDNAGSVAAFAEKMTRRAAKLGALSSRFQNPHGLHHPEHYTTPYDLALIAREAMQQPEFREFVATQNFTWRGSQGVISLKNHNKMLKSYPGCTGLKTGYTVAAKHVLVSSAMKDGREVISVVMASDKAGKWSDSAQLLTYGLENGLENGEQNRQESGPKDGPEEPAPAE